MSVPEMLEYVWDLMSDNGFTAFDTFVSFADVFIFTVLGGLFCCLVHSLCGGD